MAGCGSQSLGAASPGRYQERRSGPIRAALRAHSLVCGFGVYFRASGGPRGGGGCVVPRARERHAQAEARPHVWCASGGGGGGGGERRPARLPGDPVAYKAVLQASPLPFKASSSPHPLACAQLRDAAAHFAWELLLLLLLLAKEPGREAERGRLSFFCETLPPPPPFIPLFLPFISLPLPPHPLLFGLCCVVVTRGRSVLSRCFCFLF